MLSWLSQNAATIIISAAILAAVIAIIRGMARGKVTACGGDCSACGHCGGEDNSPCSACQHSGRCK